MILRRVRSNIDDSKSLASQVDYVPTAATFNAAESELLRLLVRPLYGNQPSIGIRELIQNAVDACHERLAYEANRPRVGSDANCVPHVTVRLDREVDGTGWVPVTDTGIGMSNSVICHYFLRVGSSFRSAKWWGDEFEDAQGHAKVIRSGRFGIGALAAFLIGDTIEVTTRHVDAPRAITFSGGLDSDNMQLTYADAPIGTTVRIRVANPHVLPALDAKPESWDWYCWRNPLSNGSTLLVKCYPNAIEYLRLPPLSPHVDPHKC